MKELVEKLRAGLDLLPDEIPSAIELILSAETADDMKAEFLTALHEKGESAEEIAGFAHELIDRSVDPGLDPKALDGPIMDVCGTGGDGLDLFNVSTTIMFILAAGGAVVVKHGNRAVTSRCGSADVLEELGVTIDLSPDDLKECVEAHGLGFIFARKYHPTFQAVAAMRARLARQNRPTIFNLLGPLLNPARPPRQLVGVFAPNLTNIFAEVLRQLGRTRAWAVHGLVEDGSGIDDISISGATTIAELNNEKITSAVLDMSWLGVPRARISDLHGGDPRESAATLVGILGGRISDARRDMAVANAGAGFLVAGLAADLREGMKMAREQIDYGRALKKLQALQNYKPRSAR